MSTAGPDWQPLRLADDGWAVEVLDQTLLPREVVVRRLASLEDAAEAIRSMRVRGAPLIGAVAAYGLCLALRNDASDAGLERATTALRGTRPTAVNLAAALARIVREVKPHPPAERCRAAYVVAAAICAEDVAINTAIGVHGFRLIAELRRADRSTQILTHCNAGRLATVDGGTALAPVYHAHRVHHPVHVWVSETRPRGQGVLTAWELEQAGIPHTVIADNAAGHLLQTGRVDLCLVGTDRTTAAGDVCNKIGTYLKALAARDNGVPFYACVPGPSIDWSITAADIPIEERDGDEVRVAGLGATGPLRLLEPDTPVANPAFDVTPARLVTGLITERGVCAAHPGALAALFPEHASGRVGA